MSAQLASLQGIPESPAHGASSSTHGRVLGMVETVIGRSVEALAAVLEDIGRELGKERAVIGMEAGCKSAWDVRAAEIDGKAVTFDSWDNACALADAICREHDGPDRWSDRGVDIEIDLTTTPPTVTFDCWYLEEHRTSDAGRRQLAMPPPAEPAAAA